MKIFWIDILDIIIEMGKVAVVTGASYGIGKSIFFKTKKMGKDALVNQKYVKFSL